MTFFTGYHKPESVKHFLDRTSQFQYRSGTIRTAYGPLFVSSLLRNAEVSQDVDQPYQALGTNRIELSVSI